MFAATFDQPAVEIIKGKSSHAKSSKNSFLRFNFLDKLYWISAQRPPQSDYNAYFFNIDNVSVI